MAARCGKASHYMWGKSMYDHVLLPIEIGGVNVQVIGDANSPRFMQVAVCEGHMAAKYV